MVKSIKSRKRLPIHADFQPPASSEPNPSSEPTLQSEPNPSSEPYNTREPRRSSEPTHPTEPYAKSEPLTFSEPEAGSAPSVVEDPTLGDLQRHAVPTRRSSVLAFEASDEPLPPPFQTLGDAAQGVIATISRPEPVPTDHASSGSALEADPATAGADVAPPLEPTPEPVLRRRANLPQYVAPTTRYVARILPLDVYKYPGYIAKNAPPWVDRNWVAYAPVDETRRPPLPAGPALNVPGAGLCRVDWFIVREQVSVEAGLTHERIAVYEPEVFYNWFRPTADPE
jgi:hypothetical protein